MGLPVAARELMAGGCPTLRRPPGVCSALHELRPSGKLDSTCPGWAVCGGPGGGVPLLHNEALLPRNGPRGSSSRVQAAQRPKIVKRVLEATADHRTPSDLQPADAQQRHHDDNANPHRTILSLAWLCGRRALRRTDLVCSIFTSRSCGVPVVRLEHSPPGASQTTGPAQRRGRRAGLERTPGIRRHRTQRSDRRSGATAGAERPPERSDRRSGATAGSGDMDHLEGLG